MEVARKTRYSCDERVEDWRRDCVPRLRTEGMMLVDFALMIASTGLRSLPLELTQTLQRGGRLDPGEISEVFQSLENLCAKMSSSTICHQFVSAYIGNMGGKS